MPQRPVEEIAREMAEEIYIIGNRLTSFDTKKEEIATVIAAALAADREQFREQLETQGQEIAMLQARERTMVEEFWDQDSVSCGNCGIQIVARGGSLNGNNGLSKAEGEDLSLCGFCAAVDMCHLERLSKQLTAKRARCEELEKALSLVMAQVACGNLVRETAHDMDPGWAMKQVPLVTALAKATALLLREEPGE